VKYIFLIAGVLMLGACSTAPPTVQTGPDAETTFDGLVRVDNSAFSDAWVDPDADWARYNQIMPGGAFFEFRAVKKTSGTTSARASSTTNEFWIDDKDRARLEEEVGAVFDDELGQSTRFTETDKPGDNVLIIRGGLHDIVSRVPPQMVGRGDFYISSVGEATLILEVVDSMSGEVLARMVERRAAQRPGGTMVVANSVTTWAEIRRMARTWASRLKDGLDGLPTE
jgi:hypothetical protein